MPSESEVLEIAERFLKEEVAPKAAEIDADPEVLRNALDGMCERDLMTLRRPLEFGGPGVSEGAFRHFQEQVARYSGTLAFLQTQHQSAGSMIAKSKNESLKREYLPKMGNGERMLGIGFSQLRRSGPPLVRARPVQGGYMLDGHVPWVTGYSFYHEFLIGATLPDGDAVFGVVPFDNVDSEAEGELSDYVEGTSLVELSAQSLLGASITGLEASFRPDVPDASPTTCSIKFSAPLQLAAMEAALTVTADLENWFLAERLVCFIQPADWIKNNDMINIVLQGHFALGCARGSLDVLQAAAIKKGLAFLQEAYAALDREFEECRAATQNPGDDRESPIDTPQSDRLAIRAWAIDLAVRCAHAAVAASSGAANSLDHPAQRLYREALVYTVSAQTPAIMDATLKRLIR